MEVVEDVVIVGAGVAGLATALGLQRKGVRSLVLESSEHLRATGFAFNMWTNAWKALDALGVGDSLRRRHVRLEALVIGSSSSGDAAARISLRLPGNSGEHEVRCVKRDVLLETLADGLSIGTIRYSSKVVHIEEEEGLKLLHLADGSTIKTKVLIGCDGVCSVVAKWLGFGKPCFSGRMSSRGLADFPEGHGFEPEFLQYVGKGFRMGFVPYDDRSIYWYFTWIPSPKDGDVESSAMKMKEFVLSKMRLANVPDRALHVVEMSNISGVVASPLLYRFPFELLWVDISRKGVCLAGDALHPMTPDIGQGACSALEDGVILSNSLAEAVCMDRVELARGGPSRITMAMDNYAKERKWRCFNLITTAYILGSIQQASDPFLCFLRDKFFGRFIIRTILERAEFDCREVSKPKLS